MSAISVSCSSSSRSNSSRSNFSLLQKFSLIIRSALEFVLCINKLVQGFVLFFLEFLELVTQPTRVRLWIEHMRNKWWDSIKLLSFSTFMFWIQKKLKLLASYGCIGVNLVHTSIFLLFFSYVCLHSQTICAFAPENERFDNKSVIITASINTRNSIMYNKTAGNKYRKSRNVLWPNFKRSE